jgi:hypothetical protein
VTIEPGPRGKHQIWQVAFTADIYQQVPAALARDAADRIAGLLDGSR